MNTELVSWDLVHQIFKDAGSGGYTVCFSHDTSPLYDFAQLYHKKYPRHQLRTLPLISERPDLISSSSLTCEKLWVEEKMVAQLLPYHVLSRLVNDRVQIELNDGSGSYYDAQTATISIKGAQDFIHEVGHYVWNTWLIRADEAQQKYAITHSIKRQNTARIPLPDCLIPNAHQTYARIIGAHSGQFIEPQQTTHLNVRKNDVEEHFARNFDYFMRGRPLDVTQKSTASLENLLQFYVQQDLSDQTHTSFYRFLLQELYGSQQLNAIAPQHARDGIRMERDELFCYHKQKKRFETRKELSPLAELALALDLTPHFVQFCLLQDKGVLHLREALQKKGITAIRL